MRTQITKDVEIREYKCPCGNGKIVYEQDLLLHLNNSVYLACPKCSKEYELDLSQGIRNWQLFKK